MGFKAPKRTATIKFDEDSPYHGAEIEMRLNVPMSVVFKLQRMDRNAPPDRMEELVCDIGDIALISWNVTDEEDNPLTANGHGLLAQPPDFFWGILNAWQEAMTTPSVPLEQPSKNGASSEAALMSAASP